MEQRQVSEWIQSGQEEEEEFEDKVGIHQGSVLSPFPVVVDVVTE